MKEVQRTYPELTQDKAEGPVLREGVDGADWHDDDAHDEVGHRQADDEHVAHLLTEKRA